MAEVKHGRYTASIDGSFVVFLIGMRINRYRALRTWVPVARAMGPMLQTLFAHPEKGFLGAEYLFNLRGPILLQYWRSFDDLERFARSPSDPHLAAWKRFNRLAAADGSTGIVHETYLVEAGAYEALYHNTPVFGLAKASSHVPATGARDTARGRLGPRGATPRTGQAR